MKRRSVRSRSIRCIPKDEEVLISSLIRRKKLPVRRKPKYLSLRLQLSGPEKSRSPESTEVPSSNTTTSSSGDLVEEKEPHDENMAYLFSAEDGGASTLTGLLDKGSTSSDDKNNDVSSGTMSPSSDSLTYGRCREVALVRTALRNKEREASEERWVQYSEVVERRRDNQEVSSCAAAATAARWKSNENQRLSLKLDYEEILTAWSDKGSLFVQSAAAAPLPQTVPDLQDDFIVPQFPQGLISHGWGNFESSNCMWRVPEFQLGRVKVEDQHDQDQSMSAATAVVVKGDDQWRIPGQREASVKRYKEKRQNRLFSKRIRYEVRKVNAEKRPRVKGRFVKRS